MGSSLEMLGCSDETTISLGTASSLESDSKGCSLETSICVEEVLGGSLLEIAGAGEDFSGIEGDCETSSETGASLEESGSKENGVLGAPQDARPKRSSGIVAKNLFMA